MTSVVNHLTYDSFGRITGQTNAAYAPQYGFTGRDWDADADLWWYRKRWYDAGVGRFASEDPIRFDGGDENLNRHVGNAPQQRSDPSGTAVFPDANSQYVCACVACNYVVGGNVLTQLDNANIDGGDDEGGGNAFRHCLAACQAKKGCGPECAEAFWQGRETPGEGGSDQDIRNNKVGFKNASSASCWDACKKSWNSGGLSCTVNGQLSPCPPQVLPPPNYKPPYRVPMRPPIPF